MKLILILIFCLSFFLAKSQHCIPINLSHSLYPGFSIEYKGNKVYKRVGFTIDVENRIYDSLGRIINISTYDIRNMETKVDTIPDMLKLFKYKNDKIYVMELYDYISLDKKIMTVYYFYNNKRQLIRQESIKGEANTNVQGLSINYYWNGVNLAKAELYVKSPTGADSLAESYEFTAYDNHPNYEKLYEDYYMIGNFKCFSNNNYTEVILKRGNNVNKYTTSYTYNNNGYPIKEIGEGYEIDIEYKCD